MQEACSTVTAASLSSPFEWCQDWTSRGVCYELRGLSPLGRTRLASQSREVMQATVIDQRRGLRDLLGTQIQACVNADEARGRI